MTTSRSVVVTVLAVVVVAAPTVAQSPVGALAIDERQGDRWGWAVDYDTAAAAQGMALQECGSDCSVVLTFGRCAAYAADQDAGSTAVGWAESYDSATGARQAALAACLSRGGPGCVVRVWGCNSPVVEEDLGLNRATRRQIQLGLQSAGFDPGGADGLFGPRTRAAIRNWQSARGVRSTGYLDGSQVEALRGPGGTRPPAPVAAGADSGGVEVVFWQSIVNSTNPADFEAYLEQFPNGVFRALAQNRLAALRGSAGGTATAVPRVGGVGASAFRARVSGAPASVSGTAAAADARRPSDVMFRLDQTCAGQPAGAACWMEISRQPGCYVWNPGLALGATVTWTGACAGGLAQGAGTLTWLWDGNRQTATGRLQDGKRNGHWVFRYPTGNVQEGPMVDDMRNGHWILRFADGSIAEGSNVDDERNGHWVIRYADGDVAEGPYVDGEMNGHWVVRSGQFIHAGPYVDGKRDGLWVSRMEGETVEVSTLYRNGERVR